MAQPPLDHVDLLYPVCALCGDGTKVFDRSQFRKTMSGTVLCPDCYGETPVLEPPHEGAK